MPGAISIGHVPSLREFRVWCGTQKYVHLIFKTFGSWEKAVKKAGLTPKKKYISPKGTPKLRYSDEELLDYMSIFWQENKKIPTETDCWRKFIPNGDIYRRRFGSMENARRLAGIVDE